MIIRQKNLLQDDHPAQKKVVCFENLIPTDRFKYLNKTKMNLKMHKKAGSRNFPNRQFKFHCKLKFYILTIFKNSCLVFSLMNFPEYSVVIVELAVSLTPREHTQ